MGEERERRPEADDVAIPVDVANEQVVLAAMAIDTAACDRLLASFPDDAFLVEDNRVACAALREMRRQGLAYEAATFARFASGRVREDYLAQLVELQREPSKNLGAHVQWLMWDRAKATMAAGPLSELLSSLQQPRAEPERVRALARMVAESIAGEVGAARYLRDPTGLVADSLAELFGENPVYPYGIPGFDVYEDGYFNRKGEDISGTPRLVPGAAPGKTTILTGLSGSGKSTMAFRLALGLGKQRRRGVYCAWEPGGNMTIRLLACMSLNWKRTNLLQARDQRDIRQPMPAEQRVQLEERMHRISKVIRVMENPFARQVTGRGKPSNDRNLDVVQEHLAASGAEWAIFDLLERAFVDTRPEEEKLALFRWQAMMEELKMHGIALAQQRLGDVETRVDKRPTREGVKGSKAWIEVGDHVVAPHRPAQWKRIDDDVLEGIILKQRYGEWPQIVSFDWDADRGSITGGKTVPYDHPGEKRDDGVFSDFVEPDRAKGRGRGKGRT